MYIYIYMFPSSLLNARKEALTRGIPPRTGRLPQMNRVTAFKKRTVVIPSLTLGPYDYHVYGAVLILEGLLRMSPMSLTHVSLNGMLRRDK